MTEPQSHTAIHTRSITRTRSTNVAGTILISDSKRDSSLLDSHFSFVSHTETQRSDVTIDESDDLQALKSDLLPLQPGEPLATNTEKTPQTKKEADTDEMEDIGYVSSSLSPEPHGNASHKATMSPDVLAKWRTTEGAEPRYVTVSNFTGFFKTLRSSNHRETFEISLQLQGLLGGHDIPEFKEPQALIGKLYLENNESPKALIRAVTSNKDGIFDALKESFKTHTKRLRSLINATSFRLKLTTVSTGQTSFRVLLVESSASKFIESQLCEIKLTLRLNLLDGGRYDLLFVHTGHPKGREGGVQFKQYVAPPKRPLEETEAKDESVTQKKIVKKRERSLPKPHTLSTPESMFVLDSLDSTHPFSDFIEVIKPCTHKDDFNTDMTIRGLDALKTVPFTDKLCQAIESFHSRFHNDQDKIEDAWLDAREDDTELYDNLRCEFNSHARELRTYISLLTGIKVDLKDYNKFGNANTISATFRESKLENINLIGTKLKCRFRLSVIINMVDLTYVLKIGHHGHPTEGNPSELKLEKPIRGKKVKVIGPRPTRLGRTAKKSKDAPGKADNINEKKAKGECAHSDASDSDSEVIKHDELVQFLQLKMPHVRWPKVWRRRI